MCAVMVERAREGEKPSNSRHVPQDLMSPVHWSVWQQDVCPRPSKNNQSMNYIYAVAIKREITQISLIRGCLEVPKPLN